MTDRALRWPGAWAALALCWPLTAQAEFEVIGSARQFALITRADVPTPIGEIEIDNASALTRLRLTGEGGWGDWTLTVAGDGVVQDGEALFGVIAAPTQLRVDDFDWSHEGDNYTFRPDLDRLSVGWLTPAFEARLGRQAIGHGSARVFFVSDVFAPLTALTLDTEYKRGVDALRVTVPLGELAEVEGYAVAHRDGASEGLYLGRLRATLFDAALDVSTLFGVTYGEPTVALDLQGNLGDAGWYAEGLSRPDLGQDGLRATAGLTYGFLDPSMTLTVEGHYNGPGGTDLESRQTAAQSLATRTGEAAFTGRAYAAALVSWEATDLLTPTLGWFQSLTDGSALLAPSLAWATADEVSVSLGGYVGLGGAESDLGPGSVVFGDVRLYF